MTMKEEWLFPGAMVPVDVETTAALVAEIKRLIDVVGGMALAQPVQEWKLREVYFDEHGEPIMHREPAQAMQQLVNEMTQATISPAPLPAQPAQEPVALPCCGYADASSVEWNPHNQVVQCHGCGQVYHPNRSQP